MTTSTKVLPLAERTDPFADMSDEQLAREVRVCFESWQLLRKRGDATRHHAPWHRSRRRSQGRQDDGPSGHLRTFEFTLIHCRK